MKKNKTIMLCLCLAFILMIGGCGTSTSNTIGGQDTATEIEVGKSDGTVSIEDIPEYTDSVYIVINDNQPAFTKEDYSETSFETYSELDSLGRCGVVYANIGTDLMPTKERGSIGHIKPTGWHSVKYDIVDGKYLYNRSHLIGHQLTGEDANEKNLITGTRYFNTVGMLMFENMVADYIKETENHVLYRVTPMYRGDNLLATGVQMEAWSVEDNGGGICFNVFVYNVQPGIVIDYATGESALADAVDHNNKKEMEYILNTSGKKFHAPDCSSVKNMKKENKQKYKGTREDLIAQGYEPCGNCEP